MVASDVTAIKARPELARIKAKQRQEFFAAFPNIRLQECTRTTGRTSVAEEKKNKSLGPLNEE
jgi:hypothetical protein